MAVSTGTKKAKTGDTTPVLFDMGFLLGTPNGDVMLKAIVNAGGVVINPATAEGLAALKDAVATNAKAEEIRAVVATLATNDKAEAIRAILANQLTALGTLATEAGIEAVFNAITQGLFPGEQHVGSVGGDSKVSPANFTRPNDTTAYAVGDLVANSTAAGSVTALVVEVSRKNGGTGRITRGRLTKGSTPIVGAIFRAHLFKTAPTLTALQDNNALTMDNALGYIGSMDFDMTGNSARIFTDGVKVLAVPNVGGLITFDTASDSKNIYVLLEARGAYAPAAAEKFTIALEVDRD